MEYIEEWIMDVWILWFSINEVVLIANFLGFMCVYFQNILKDNVFSHVFEKETFDLTLERIIYFFLNSINILKLSILFIIFYWQRW